MDNIGNAGKHRLIKAQHKKFLFQIQVFDEKLLDLINLFILVSSQKLSQ